MRIVITGDGEIAYQLARALHDQHDVVVIEDEPDEAARFERLDVQLLHGKSANPETLRDAGVASAESFIACRRSDEINIIACLTAKRIGCTHTTCFVHKEEYVRSFAGLAEGVWDSPDAFLASQGEPTVFTSGMTESDRRKLLSGWDRAVEAAISWARAH